MVRPKFAVIVLCNLVAFLLINPSAFAKSSRKPITDREISEKKQVCYADIESGLWGNKCRSSMIEKENCMLRCLSQPCYSLIYESDPLEEGERDYARSQEFRYCMNKLSLGESLEDVKGAFTFE